MNPSPYAGRPESEWAEITKQLIDAHPLTPHVVNIVMNSWQGLLETSIGRVGLKMGVDIFPSPQVIGGFLHELIPAEIESSFPGEWRKEKYKTDKDIVCVADDYYSIELKTSSNKSSIFGNRSYAQKIDKDGKVKDGFYIAINFEKFVQGDNGAGIKKIRFGWLDHTDWIAQKASTGQQARLAPITYSNKFITLYG